ncbi:gamma-aminobutyric acid type B receptor subunit 1-like [Amphiura filiformis]|uniref:gamma-aminobutyric acid type B receptor subunit 1-like n=1 Tax=Amphiura filiformis TaxID=82378 RepID=UPI003B20E2F6
MAWTCVLFTILMVMNAYSAQEFNGTTRDPFTDMPTSVVTNFIMTSSGPQVSLTGSSLPIIGTTQPSHQSGETDYGDGPIPLYIMGLFPILGDEFNRGPSARIASQLALEHINDRADILPGYEMKMNWIDTKCNAGVGTQALFEYVNSNTTYHMLLGAGCSAVAQTVSLAADLWNILQVSYSASSPALSQRKQYKSFFRTNAADSLYNYARLAIIQKYNWNKVATLHENQEVFSTTINHFSTLLNANGIELITSESFTVDPAEQISNLKEKGAWIIFGNFFENMARRVFCEVYKEGLYGKNYAWFLLGRYQDKWWEVEDNSTGCTPQQIYTALEGYISTENIPLSIFLDNVTVSGYTPSEYQTMFNQRVEKEQSETAGPAIDVNQAAASYAYDATWTMALALNQSINVLENNPNITSRLEYFTYEDVEMREVLMNKMSTLEFDGVSGPVSFTETGDREGLIDIRQMRDDPDLGKTEVKIGVYAPQEQRLTLDGIVWEGGVPPKDETTEEIQDSYIPAEYLYIACALASIGMLLLLVCCGFTIVYRLRSCVMKAEPGFLMLLLFGGSLIYTSIVLMGLDKGSVGDHFVTVCKITSWTLTLGFSCSFGALFAKIYRAHKLLVSKANLWKPGPHGGYMALTIAFFLLVDIVVLIVWTTAFPMEYSVQKVATTFDEYSNTLITREVEYCSKGNSVFFIVGLCVFHGLSLLLGAFLSYETRELKILTLNDTFWTGIAVYCVVTLTIVSAPLSFILANDPRVSYVVVAALAWVAVTLTILIVFVPKFLSVRGSLSQRRNSQTRTDDEIYEEEVDEETKLRHKIDEIDKQIAVVKRELRRRQHYGRLAVRHGCGLWCCGSFLGCNCGEREAKIEMPKGLENAQYDNRALDVSDVNITAAGYGEKGRLSLDGDTPPTEPAGNGHDSAIRAGSSSSSSSGKDIEDETEMKEKTGITGARGTGDEIIEDDDDGENTRL